MLTRAGVGGSRGEAQPSFGLEPSGGDFNVPGVMNPLGATTPTPRARRRYPANRLRPTQTSSTRAIDDGGRGGDRVTGTVKAESDWMSLTASDFVRQ